MTTDLEQSVKHLQDELDYWIKKCAAVTKDGDELRASLAACDAERTDLRNWFERRSVYGEVDPSVMTMRQMADHVYERVMAKLESLERLYSVANVELGSLRAKLATVEAQEEEESSEHSKLIEYVTSRLEGRNDHSAFETIDNTLARLEEARWLLDGCGGQVNSWDWNRRRGAWLSGHTPTERVGKEAK